MIENPLRQLINFFYWIFESVTSEMAFKYELNNRIEDQDCRRIGFAKQEELLEVLNPEWSNRQKKNI